MSNPVHRPWRPNGETAEPRTISLTIDAELLSSAKALDIDLAASLEEMLRTTIHARNIQHVGEEQSVAANCNADSGESKTQPGW
jgi:post-segregation antitoxin (ccd killing protein)